MWTVSGLALVPWGAVLDEFEGRSRHRFAEFVLRRLGCRRNNPSVRCRGQRKTRADLAVET
jgi:hypothetical protein